VEKEVLGRYRVPHKPQYVTQQTAETVQQATAYAQICPFLEPCFTDKPLEDVLLFRKAHLSGPKVFR
jgi:hypothetical protein